MGAVKNKMSFIPHRPGLALDAAEMPGDGWSSKPFPKMRDLVPTDTHALWSSADSADSSCEYPNYSMEGFINHPGRLVS